MMKHIPKIFLILAFSAGCIAFFALNTSKPKEKPVQLDASLLLLPDFAKTINELPEFIDGLPESHLKNNLQIALAAEYAGDSQQLNIILQEYAKMKIKELKEKQTY